MKTIGYYLHSLNSVIQQRLAESRDKKIDRKIVVFESDDWGAIRVPSKHVHNSLIESGYRLDERPYEHLDGLERKSDIEKLAQILMKYKDVNGNHPVFTLNYLSANPNFDALRANNFEEYVSESIEDTYANYPGSPGIIDFVKEGEVNAIFNVQFHGREHFDIAAWMNGLQNGNQDLLTAFEYNMCGIFPKMNPSMGNKYMVALKSAELSNDIITEGYNEFCRIWNKRPKSFIAPCYTWPADLGARLAELGFTTVQGSRFQRIFGQKRQVPHWIGQTDKFGLKYTVRNCTFEPSTSKGNIVDMTLSQIERCFLKRVPAIINTHRINYTGRISEENPGKNLKMLDHLLSELVKRYKDLEFHTSIELSSL